MATFWLMKKARDTRSTPVTVMKMGVERMDAAAVSPSAMIPITRIRPYPSTFCMAHCLGAVTDRLIIIVISFPPFGFIFLACGVAFDTICIIGDTFFDMHFAHFLGGMGVAIGAGVGNIILVVAGLTGNFSFFAMIQGEGVSQELRWCPGGGAVAKFAL